MLHGPHFLTNLSPEEAEQFKLDWQRTAKPADLERVRAVKQALEHLELGGPLLLEYCLGLTNERIISVAEKSEQRARDAVDLLAGQLH